jgi:hypothetical protein
MAERLLPEMSPHREALVLERFVLQRRAMSLIEHFDLLEANGCDARFVGREIGRVQRALRAVENRLWEGDGNEIV